MSTNEARGLVERLRAISRRGYWPLLGYEAADEIERLQTERDELLEALQCFIDWLDSRAPHGDPSLQQLARVDAKARAAITKATGEQP